MDRQHALGHGEVLHLAASSPGFLLRSRYAGRKESGSESSNPTREGYEPSVEQQVVNAARGRRAAVLQEIATAAGPRRAIADGGWVGLSMVLMTSALAALIFLVVLNAISENLNSLAFAAVFAASLLSSIAGFAFSAICGAMLFPVIGEPVRVVQIMMVCSIAIQMLSVASLRNTIDWRHLGRFVVAGLAGLPVGIYLLMKISASLYLQVIGGFLIVYGTYMVARRARPLKIESTAGDWLAGFMGGVTGGFAAFPGAFVTIWCGLKGWDKNRQRGVYQPFILIMQVIALAAISLAKISQGHGSGIDLSAAVYLAPALLGTWSGLAIFRRLSDWHFSLWVNFLLIVSGLGLVL
jgi:uncharacterized protein